MARERTGHPPSHAEAKETKSLTLTNVCLLGKLNWLLFSLCLHLKVLLILPSLLTMQ